MIGTILEATCHALASTLLFRDSCRYLISCTAHDKPMMQIIAVNDQPPGRPPEKLVDQTQLNFLEYFRKEATMP